MTNLPAAGVEALARIRPWRRYSEALATVVCTRLARGERLMEICRDEGLPSRTGVRSWAKRRPDFAARLKAAMTEGRRAPDGGVRGGYCPHVAALICDRIAAGMTVAQACDLPGLPCVTTVYNWLPRHAAFREAYAQARMVQAHRRFDQVWEIAEAATPGTAYLARVKMEAARWQAARLAPKRYGAAAPDEAQPDAGRQVRVVIRRFDDDEDEDRWKANFAR